MKRRIFTAVAALCLAGCAATPQAPAPTGAPAPGPAPASPATPAPSPPSAPPAPPAAEPAPRPVWPSKVLQHHYDGVSDDLLTAGLGKTGLGQTIPPAMSDSDSGSGTNKSTG